MTVSLRRLTAILAAVLAGLLLITALVLHHQQVSVSVESLPSGPGMPPMPAPPRPQALPASPGGPVGFTNEMQAQNLLAQKKTAGISGIIVNQGESQDRQALLDQIAQARTPDEAISALRQLSAMNQAAQSQAGRRAPIYVAGNTPKLLAEPGGASAPEKGEPLSLEDWSAVVFAPLGQSRVIADPDAFAEFWHAAFAGQLLPNVNFSQEEIAALVLGPLTAKAAVPGESLEIVSAGPQDGVFVISYRRTLDLNIAALSAQAKALARGPLWLCALKKIPRTALEVRFAEAP